MTSLTTTADAAEPAQEPVRGQDAPCVLSVRSVHEGWGRSLVTYLRFGDGSENEREVEDHGAVVAVLSYDPERREALLVRQLRPAALLAAGLTTMLEAPAGRLEGRDPAACAARGAFDRVRLGARSAGAGRRELGHAGRVDLACLIQPGRCRLGGTSRNAMDRRADERALRRGVRR